MFTHPFKTCTDEIMGRDTYSARTNFSVAAIRMLSRKSGILDMRVHRTALRAVPAASVAAARAIVPVFTAVALRDKDL